MAAATPKLLDRTGIRLAISMPGSTERRSWDGIRSIESVSTIAPFRRRIE
jgi:hypothetical protein